MTILIADSVMDAALDAIENATSPVLHVCSGDPGDRAAVITNSLADHTLTSGDFTKANGDTSGRKLTMSQQADIDIDATGTAAHVCIIDSSELLLKTTCTSQALTSGGTVTVPAFDYEIADAAAE
ncbi:MAG: hypothetical protein ACPGVG_17720 [Mycobacterium sp.]